MPIAQLFIDFALYIIIKMDHPYLYQITDQMAGLRWRYGRVFALIGCFSLMIVVITGLNIGSFITFAA